MRRSLGALLLATMVSLKAEAQPASRASLADWVRDEPSNAAVWCQYGAEQFSAGRYRESVAAYERALQLSGGRMPGLADRIAEAYGLAGNVKQARRWQALAALPRLDPSSVFCGAHHTDRCTKPTHFPALLALTNS